MTTAGPCAAILRRRLANGVVGRRGGGGGGGSYPSSSPTAPPTTSCSASTLSTAAAAAVARTGAGRGGVGGGRMVAARAGARGGGVGGSSSSSHGSSGGVSIWQSTRRRALSTTSTTATGTTGAGGAGAAAAAAPAVPKPPSSLMARLPKYAPLALLNFGNSCALLSFCMTDVFYLRSLALIATTCGVIYNATHTPPLRIPTAWGLVFLTVNGTMILSLLFEEGEIHFSKEELDLFEEHFLPYGLSPTQFRKVMGRGKWVEAPAGAVLAVEGEPLPRLLLIANGRVQASVNKVPISSFSTFPGARASEANRGIDSGAWIGEINFLDEDKKAKGAIATFVTESPTRYLAWEHHALRELLAEDQKLSRGMTNAITGALVGKLLSFTTKTQTAAAETYGEIMHTVLVDDRVEPSEKAFIREYRQKHGISDDVHKETLARLGWTAEEFEDGGRHSENFTQQAFRRINEGLIRRQTTIMGGGDDDDDDDDDDGEKGDGDRGVTDGDGERVRR